MSAGEIYRNLDQSLEAAQVLAQWVRWKTITRPGEISKTGRGRGNRVEEAPIFLYGLAATSVGFEVAMLVRLDKGTYTPRRNLP